jgi:uncharacterized membrane protein
VPADAYLLVLLSAATHAYWNLLLKRSGGSQLFVALSKVVEAALLGVLLAFWAQPLRSSAADPWPVWVWPLVGGSLVLANYVLLAAAYRRGDLSFVYPVSRGAVLVFLPPLALASLGERLDGTGWLAIVSIVAGIFFVQLRSVDGGALIDWLRAFRSPATVFAIAAAWVAAGYTVWDKLAVQRFPAFTYFATYSVIVGIAYAAAMPFLWPAEAVSREWRRHRAPIVQVAVLNSTSYLLALAALRTGKASYVIALRQLSIVVGALLGAWLLKEVIPTPRRIGIALVVLGCLLLSLAR